MEEVRSSYGFSLNIDLFVLCLKFLNFFNFEVMHFLFGYIASGYHLGKEDCNVQTLRELLDLFDRLRV